MSNTACVGKEPGTTYHSRTSMLTQGFVLGSVLLIFIVLYVVTFVFFVVLCLVSTISDAPGLSILDCPFGLF